ncbi:MAG: hypothetical protein ACOCXA_07770 [Planctomycetota bacterium]
MSRFASILREYLAANHMEQQDLADRVHISKQLMNNMIMGYRRPPKDHQLVEWVERLALPARTARLWREAAAMTGPSPSFSARWTAWRSWTDGAARRLTGILPDGQGPALHRALP